MTGPAAPAIAGSALAFRVFHPSSPTLRMRYRHGVAVGPHGFPDWVPYARVVVELPAVPPDRGVDETRVRDVVTANRVAAASGDPLWEGIPPEATPTGWTWAHLAGTRRAALVPIELHGAFRHLGGVSTLRAGRRRRGLPLAPASADAVDPAGSPPPVRHLGRLAPDLLDMLEQRLAGPLPPAYRRFLADTNGGPPLRPAVHPGFGFVVDQPFFGLARSDRAQELLPANQCLADRLTGQFLAIGQQQGGLLAVRVAGRDHGSVWYLDDDDPRDRDGYTAADVCAKLLHRVAGDVDRFWAALRDVPAGWSVGPAAVVEVPDAGVRLPANRRAGVR